jgi:hypothetical protein
MGARALLSTPPPALSSLAPEVAASPSVPMPFQEPVTSLDQTPQVPASQVPASQRPASQRASGSAPRISPMSVWRPPAPEPPAEAEVEVDVSATAPPPPPPAQDSGEEMGEAERALQAMTDFRLAETALQRNDVEKAEKLARQAVEGEPSNGEYIAFLAWIHALSGRHEAVQEAIAKLGEVLKADALCERALLYRGKLFKKSNRLAEAIRDFQTVLDVNPRNNEAASEARLLRMQKKKK